MARQWEHTARLAMIRAVSRDTRDARVNADDVKWADLVVQRSVDLLCSGIEGNVADSGRERNSKLIEVIIRQNQGITKSQIIQKTRFLSTRERSEILAELIEAGIVECRAEANMRKPGPPASRYYMIQ
jgi:hypothetical protein